MIAAIYARKSTSQDVAEDAKSVTRQVENAKAFAASQHWKTDDRYIFIDDGVSGAETRKLVQKQKLLEMITKGAPFGALVMQAQDRFSRRDGDEVLGELKRIVRAGVEVWFYADGQRFKHGDFASNTLGFLRGEFAAEFRRAIAQKTHEAMLRRAKLGYVVGNKVFGYDNVRKDGHVIRQVNKSEAAVVRDIFSRYARNQGFKQIAHALNAAKKLCPRPQRRRVAGWDPGTVRAVLRRSLYRGVVIYNKTKKRDLDGSRHPGRQPKKPEAEWIRVDMPELRLVDPAVIETVDRRLNAKRDHYLRTTKGRLLGRPVEGKHLLAGFLQCDECGGTFEAARGYYVCATRRRKGPTVCPNETSLAVEATDNLILTQIERQALDPDFIDRVLDTAFEDRPDDDRAELVKERARLASEIQNLTTAIGQGGDLPALVVALTDRDKQLKSLDARLAQPKPEPLDRETLRAALELRGQEWRGVLRSKHISQARLVLQHLIELPFQVWSFHDAPPHIRKELEARGVKGQVGRGKQVKEVWCGAKTRANGLTTGLVQSVASPPRYPDLYLLVNART
jgi:DNA invertase Pin-like site-specific DNA recombinase